MIQSGRKKLVLILFLMIWIAIQAPADPSHEPGVYRDDLYFSIERTDEPRYYRILIGNVEAENGDWELFSGPVELSALRGEERSYRVELKEGEAYNYLIDKKAPAPPELTVDRDEKVNFRTEEDGVRIFYRIYAIDFGRSTSFTPWNGQPVPITFSDSDIVRIESYCEDSAGNRSTLAFDYAEQPYRGPSTVPILSPPQGVFLNPQLFYIDTQGYDWIRYTIDNEDPVLRGAPYLSPLLIRSRGLVRLRVAALPTGSSEPVYNEITFAQFPTETAGIPASGLYSKPLSIAFPPEVEEYSLLEAGPPQKLRNGSITVKGIDGALSLHPLRFTVKGESGPRVEDLPEYQGEYRFLYVMDNRIPGAPRIDIDGTVPFSDITTVSLTAGDGESIYYTLNGATPDRYALRYERPFTIDPARWGEQGAVELRTVAYGKNGIQGNERRILLPYDTIPPGTPQVSAEEITDGTYRLNISLPEEEEATILYEIAFGEEAPEPGPESPHAESRMTVKIPKGSYGKASMRFAAIDSAGNISAVREPVTLSYDSLAPGAVEIIREDGIISCRSSGESIEYLLEKIDPETGLIISDEDFEWQAYTGPVKLDTGSAGVAVFRFSARAVDRTGNMGAVNTIESIELDRRSTFPFTLKGIPGDGVSGNSLILTIETAVAAGVRYSLSERTDTAEVAGLIGSGVYDKPLVIEGYKDRETWYQLEIIPFSRITERKDSLGSFAFIIDREAPEVPRLPEDIDMKFFRENSYIRLSDISEDARYWFLLEPYTKDVDMPSRERFLEQGFPVKSSGTMYLDFGNRQGPHRLTLMAMDSIGNYAISDTGSIVNFDSVPPESPSVSSVMVSDGWRIIVETSEEERLEPDTDDFFLPFQESPYRESASLDLVSIDKAGNRSAPATIAVLGRTIFLNGKPIIPELENKNGTSPFSEFGEVEKIPAVDTLVSGLPRHFWSNEKVTIYPAAEGIIRYELSLGSEAGTVTDRSDQLDEPIVLDIREGEAFHVSLNVALFTRLGGKELPIAGRRYRFGIDRTPPAPPGARGVEDGQYYRDDRRIILEHDEAGISAIRYRIVEGSRSGGDEGEFKTYNRELNISADKGSYSDYLLESYAVDEAGNRSEISRIQFAIDKAVLYVAPGGKPGDGSRDSPYSSLGAALEDAVSNGMTTILLSEGNHAIGRSVVLENLEIKLEGGFSYPEWRKGSGISAITTSPSFGTGALFDIRNSNLILRNLSVDNLTSRGAVIRQERGITTMEGVRLFQAAGSVDSALNIDAGKLFIRESEIIFGPMVSGSIISINDGELSLSETNIKGSTKSSGTALIRSNNSRVTLDRSSIAPGESDRLTLLSTEGGSLTILDSLLTTGNSDSRATGISIQNTDLYILDSTFRSGDSGRLSFLIDARESAMVIEKSLFLSDGNEGSVQIKSSGGSLQATETVFARKSGTRGFLYGIQADKSTLSVHRSIFYYPAGGDTIAIDCRTSPVQVSESSFVLPPESSSIGYAMRGNQPSTTTISASMLISENRNIPAFFSSQALVERFLQDNNLMRKQVEGTGGPEQKKESGFPLFGAAEDSSHPASEFPSLYRSLQGADPLR